MGDKRGVSDYCLNWIGLGTIEIGRRKCNQSISTYEAIVKGVLGRPFKYAVPINNDGEIPCPRHFRQCKLIFLEDLLQYSQLPWKIDVLLLFSQDFQAVY